MNNILLLQKLGLSEYEARAYLALAKLGPSSVREIVSESHIPRNKAYDALEHLEQKNKVATLPVSPKKYIIVDPEQFKQELNEAMNGVDEIIKLVSLPKMHEQRELFWIIKGQKAISDKMALESLHVKEEILTCNNLGKLLYQNIRAVKDAVRRGVIVKVICSFDMRRKHIYQEWIRAGAQIRIYPEKFGAFVPRMTVYDEVRARFTIGRPEIRDSKDYITLWTESKAFSTMIRQHFLILWKQSRQIEKYLKK